MPLGRSLRLGLVPALLASSMVLSAQSAERSQVVQVQAKKGEKITCPFELDCDTTEAPAFQVTNTLGTAIDVIGKIGLLAHSDDPGNAAIAGIASGPGGIGVEGFSLDGPGLLAVSQGPTLFTACFNSIGLGCGAGNAVRIDNAGTVFANGGFVTGGADVAEFVQSMDSVEPGDVVEIDSNHAGSFRRASHRASTSVAGVISTTPGLTMNSSDAANAAKDGPRLALVGRVRVKATAANGTIRPGDLLVSSSSPGRAMRAGKSPRPGTVFGKALEGLDEGEGVVEMLVWAR